MAINNAAGSLSDVRAARRELTAALFPWWGRIVVTVGVALYVALMFGGPTTLAVFVLAIAAGAAPQIAFALWRRRLRVRKVRGRSWISPVAIVSYVAIVVVISAVYVLQALLPWDTALAYVVQFVAAFAVLTGAYVARLIADGYWTTSAARKAASDGRAAVDNLIRPRQRLRLCAALAAIEEIETGLLAKVVRLSPADTAENLTAFTQAQYISTRHDTDDPRQVWISLTPAGRKAYGAHLATLAAQSTAAPPRDVPAPELGPPGSARGELG